MRNRCGLGVLIACMIAGIALVPSASAARPPTKREAAAIARAVGNAPPTCLTIRASTVDSSALAEFSSRPPTSCDRFAANGVALLKRRGESWKVIFGASCCFRCRQIPAPAAVKRDLRFPGCVTAATSRDTTDTRMRDASTGTEQRVDDLRRTPVIPTGSRAARRLASAAVAALRGGARLQAMSAAYIFKGPSSAPLDWRVTFIATGVPAGTYTLRLVISIIPDRIVVGTACTRRIGTRTRAAGGRVTISGRLPLELACQSGAGPIEGYYRTRPRKCYLVTISRDVAGAPFGGEPFLKHSLRVTG
jgi:hypothetical protein